MKRNFKITFELVPARASGGKAVNDILLFAKEAAKDGKISALSITDNAGGHPALAPKALGREIKAFGIDPIIHFSCKDKNRNLMESELFELDRLGLKKLLIVTGDYPRYGFKGNAKPVFDMDSVQALMMIKDMNMGRLLDQRAPGGGIRLAPTAFSAGCVVSPFKRLEAELIPQYQKLIKKLSLGPRFIISQMGFDARKYDELKKILDQALSMLKPAKPPALIGTIFIPTPGLAKTLHAGGVPGCIMPRRLLETIETEAIAPDQGLEARLERGAKMVAILKGIGYDGAHLSGPQLRYEHVAQLLERSDEISPYWNNFIGEFMFPEEWRYWYFKKDPVTGLNLAEPDGGGIRPRPGIREALSFWLGDNLHRLAFEQCGKFFGPLRFLAGYIDKRAALRDGLTHFEHIIKSISYDCQDCGDCMLKETAFICPQSQCAKFLFNGPCGGSMDGWCEVWPGKKRCIYVRAYERSSGPRPKFYKNNNKIEIIGPRNWSLYKTSSWLNFYLGKDHQRIKNMEHPKQNY